LAARILVQDSTGATLVFEQPPQSIVSLVPTASEILVTIGAGDRLKGPTYHDVTLSGSDKREVVGGFFNPCYAHVLSVFILLSSGRSGLFRRYSGQILNAVA